MKEGYSFREGPKSQLEFRGTAIALAADGKGEVEFQDGRTRVDVKVQKLPDPQNLGPYTTFVLWAITVDGRANNLGSLELRNGRGSLDTTTPLSQFALIVTAEPHFAVTAPSKAVVLRNLGKRIKGESIMIKGLAERMDYANLQPRKRDPRGREPLDLVQARYAADTARIAALAQERQEAAAKQAREAAEAEARRAAELASESSQQREKQAAAAAGDAASRRAREELIARLNRALPTRETDRGVVAEIAGVQFATGAAVLNISAREALARFAGIVGVYPSIRFKVEGHTDSTGSAATNKDLSLRRALTVRDYLIAQGVAASSIDAEGLGPDRPVADNSSADGRARNRRVEIVLTGGPINTGT